MFASSAARHRKVFASLAFFSYHPNGESQLASISVSVFLPRRHFAHFHHYVHPSRRSECILDPDAWRSLIRRRMF